MKTTLIAWKRELLRVFATVQLFTYNIYSIPLVRALVPRGADSPSYRNARGIVRVTQDFYAHLEKLSN